MEDTRKLYCDLCAEFKVTNKKDQKKLFKVLNSYKVYDKNKKVDVNELIKIFLEAKKSEGMSVNTIGCYKGTLRMFSSYLEKEGVVSVDKNIIRNFLSFLDTNRKSTTINQHLQRIRSFYNWCSGEDLINNNPSLNVVYKGRKEQKHGMTQEEVVKVKDCCTKTRDLALVNFLLTTGCRVSEVCNLKVSDIDFNDNSARVTGKGDKTRLVLFNDDTKELLKGALKASKNTEYMFSSRRKPYGKLERFAIEKQIRNIGKKANLSYQLHPHMFRHTFATNCLENGMDLISIQKLLGHSDLSTTAVYAETSYKKIKEQYDSMFNFWLKKRHLFDVFFIWCKYKTT